MKKIDAVIDLLNKASKTQDIKDLSFNKGMIESIDISLPLSEINVFFFLLIIRIKSILYKNECTVKKKDLWCNTFLQIFEIWIYVLNKNSELYIKSMS